MTSVQSVYFDTSRIGFRRLLLNDFLSFHQNRITISEHISIAINMNWKDTRHELSSVQDESIWSHWRKREENHILIYGYTNNLQMISQNIWNWIETQSPEIQTKADSWLSYLISLSILFVITSTNYKLVFFTSPQILATANCRTSLV